MESTDGFERLVRPRPDLGRRHAEVLEPESDLVPDERHHDLVLGILEDRRGRPGEHSRPRPAGVHPGHEHAAGEAPAVEMRNEPGERAKERRFPGAGRAEQRDDLARLEPKRDVLERRLRRSGIAELQAADVD